MLKNKINNTCHHKLDSGFHKGNRKRGAMFGLDARVALAIFGALSVITGAALYSAMKEAKVIALMTELDNIDKAITQYLLDTGSFPPPDTSNVSITNSGLLKIEELLESSVRGWKGPYTGLLSGGETYDLDHPTYTRIYAFRKYDAVWSGDYGTENVCLSGSASCSVYICVDGIHEDMKKALDFKVDGGEGSDSGNFRYNAAWACKKGMTYDKSLSPASIP